VWNLQEAAAHGPVQHSLRPRLRFDTLKDGPYLITTEFQTYTGILKASNEQQICHCLEKILFVPVQGLFQKPQSSVLSADGNGMSRQ